MHAGTTYLRELDLALVQSAGLSGCVAAGEKAMASAHEYYIWPLHWFQGATCQLIAHLVAQEAAVRVNLDQRGDLARLWPV